jgi:hypothetical protein
LFFSFFFSFLKKPKLELSSQLPFQIAEFCEPRQ